MKKKFLCSLVLVLSLALSADAEIIGTLNRSNANIPESAEVNDVMLTQGYKDELLASVFDKNFKAEGTSMKFYDSLMLMQLALNKGDIEVFSAPEFVGEYLLRSNPEYIMRGFMMGRNPIALAFGFLEEKKELCEKFSKAIEAMENEGKIGLLARDFITGPKAANPETVKFEKFDDAEIINVAVTGDMPPLDYVGADGQPAGFNTAILAEIGRRLHVNIKTITVETGARPAALKSGRADAVFWLQLFSGYEDFTKQPDIPEGVIVSTPYFGWNKSVLIGLPKK